MFLHSDSSNLSLFFPWSTSLTKVLSVLLIFPRTSFWFHSFSLLVFYHLVHWVHFFYFLLLVLSLVCSSFSSIFRWKSYWLEIFLNTGIHFMSFMLSSLKKSLFFHYHSAPYTPSPCSHHPVVCAHESFFPPSLIFIQLKVHYDYPFDFLIHWLFRNVLLDFRIFLSFLYFFLIPNFIPLWWRMYFVLLLFL